MGTTVVCVCSGMYVCMCMVGRVCVCVRARSHAYCMLALGRIYIFILQLYLCLMDRSYQEKLQQARTKAFCVLYKRLQIKRPNSRITEVRFHEGRVFVFH